MKERAWVPSVEESNQKSALSGSLGGKGIQNSLLAMCLSERSLKEQGCCMQAGSQVLLIAHLVAVGVWVALAGFKNRTSLLGVRALYWV